MEKPTPKPLAFLGSTLRELQSLPEDVKDVVGYALHVAQEGGEHPDAKALKGFKGRGVLEVIDDYQGDTYRAVYTVKFDTAVYVLHVFQKKSKRGSETPKPDIDTIKSRLKQAEVEHKAAKEAEKTDEKRHR